MKSQKLTRVRTLSRLVETLDKLMFTFHKCMCMLCMYVRVLHILANFELTLAWVKSVCEMGQLKLVVQNFSDFYQRLEVLPLD